MPVPGLKHAGTSFAGIRHAAIVSDVMSCRQSSSRNPEDLHQTQPFIPHGCGNGNQGRVTKGSARSLSATESKAT